MDTLLASIQFPVIMHCMLWVGILVLSVIFCIFYKIEKDKKKNGSNPSVGCKDCRGELEGHLISRAQLRDETKKLEELLK